MIKKIVPDCKEGEGVFPEVSSKLLGMSYKNLGEGETMAPTEIKRNGHLLQAKLKKQFVLVDTWGNMDVGQGI